MDQTAEPVVPLDLAWRRACRAERDGDCLGRLQAEGAVRAVSVVVGHVLAQDSLELAAVNDQHPVEALPAEGSHPTLGVSVGERRQLRPVGRFRSDSV